MNFRKLNKIIASLAISGLVFMMASPALASVDYDPNDPFFDPSGTYVPPAPPVIPTVPAADSTSGTQGVADSSQTTGDTSAPATIAGEQSVSTPASDGLSAEQSSSNSQTGSGSDNASSSNNTASQNTEVNNDAAVTNDVNASAGTGDNQSSQNTGNGSVETGDADLVANIITAANSIISGANSMALPIINYFGDLLGNLSFDGGSGNASDLMAGKSIADIVSNSATGANSTNTAEIATDNSSETDFNNDGRIDNNLNLGASTGGNEASQNTGDGNIQTGDANIASNVVNFLNNTVLASDWWMGMINIFGDWTGNLLLPSFAGTGAGTGSTSLNSQNSTTGADSTNTASNQLTNSSDTNINNDANIFDGVDINANTGGNESMRNTSDGTIQTGDANIKNNQLTVANNTVTGDGWWMLLVNTLGGWTGAIIGSPDGSTSFMPFLFGESATNVATGADSTNSATVDTSNQTDTQITNEAGINNHLVLNADTGNNKANENTGSGSIQTGDANVMSNLVNFVNNTFNVHKWLFGIVNVFGTWDGSAQFGDAGAGNGTLGGLNLSASASNSQTGADSDNSAKVSDEQKTDLKINNDLRVNSDVKIKANTGENKTDKNTGSGAITTGDINADGTMAVFGNITEIELPGGGNGSDLSAGNDKTGAGSENNAFVKVIGKMKIVINNAANVCKKVVMDLNTGNNSADKNTGDGSVETGDIKASFTEKEVLNIVKISTPPKEEITPEKGGVPPEEEITPEKGAGLEEVISLGGTLPQAGQEIVWPILAALAIFTTIRKRHVISDKVARIFGRG